MALRKLGDHLGVLSKIARLRSIETCFLDDHRICWLLDHNFLPIITFCLSTITGIFLNRSTFLSSCSLVELDYYLKRTKRQIALRDRGWFNPLCAKNPNASSTRKLYSKS